LPYLIVALSQIT